jgi:hypothetical protein
MQLFTISSAFLFIATSALAVDASGDDGRLFEATARNQAVVHFAEGKADIAPAEADRVRQTVADAQRSGKVSEIIVAAWSDKEYPTKTAKLTRDDERLAKRRTEVVRLFVQNLAPGGLVHGYSMAQYPSWLARVFRTDEAKLKQAVPASDITGQSRDDLALQYYGKLLREIGGPMSAAIVIRERDDAATH